MHILDFMNYKNDLDKLRRINLNEHQLFDLEMIMVGGFSPLKGFLNEADYYSVLDNLRLANGDLWPIPITLDVSRNFDFFVGESVVLCDPYGNPLAVMEIESRYEPNKELEARSVYGMTNQEHPGVWRLMNQANDVYLGGSIHVLRSRSYGDFDELRHTPQELKDIFIDKRWTNVIAFQTRNPMHRAHFELVKNASEHIGAPVLIHPVVGVTSKDDINYITRVQTYKIICEKYGKEFTILSLLPLAMRMAGPREALWHMLIRKNYGATHFIVGRDHAGPGKDSFGNPFYGPNEASDLAEKYADEVGMKVVSSAELMYSKVKKRYVSVEKIQKGEEVESISGTEFRRRLLAGEEIPDWFSFPETIDILRSAINRQSQRGLTIFLTGLSGSGKSTIANALVSKLLERQEKGVTLLDGDVIRSHLTSELGFSKEHRDLNVQRVGFVASEITKHGGIAVCALIAPYAKARAKARELVEQHGDFIEVHVSTPLAVCEERDVKGLYAKARKGLIKGFTGIDDPYEAPENPEFIIDTSNNNPDNSVQEIIEFISNINPAFVTKDTI